ncbi:hypothetical protein ACFUEM_08695 [Streptomyces anulatus]|uniref:hypothetical protein n=1 Tax=Streptomyces anulatus TaxID=1892 RepID=UPI0035DD50FC
MEHLAADRDRWRRGHERAEAQLVPTRRRLEKAEARLDAVRAYALERCTEPYMNEASASWVLHLLGDDLRESTRGASMEYVGEVDGETVWRLKSAEDS